MEIIRKIHKKINYYFLLRKLYIYILRFRYLFISPREKINKICPYSKCCTEPNKECECYVVYAYGKCGGENYHEYIDEIEMTKNDCCISSKNNTFDQIYHDFYFNIPTIEIEQKLKDNYNTEKLSKLEEGILYYNKKNS